MNPQQRNTLGFRGSVLGKRAFGWVVSGWVLLQALFYFIQIDFSDGGSFKSSTAATRLFKLKQYFRARLLKQQCSLEHSDCSGFFSRNQGKQDFNKYVKNSVFVGFVGFSSFFLGWDKCFSFENNTICKSALITLCRLLLQKHSSTSSVLDTIIHTPHIVFLLLCAV